MTCKQGNLKKGTESITVNPVEMADACLYGSQRLMVSDNPETLGSSTVPDGGGTLWHDSVNTMDTMQRHRVFIWHANSSSSPTALGLTLENLSGTNRIQVDSCRKETCIVPVNDIVPVGICLAKSCLGSTLDVFSPVDPIIGPGSSGLIIKNFFEDGQLLGAIIEFTVSVCQGSGNLHYNLRTVAAKENGINLRTILTAPLPASAPHPRGSWAMSEVMAATPLYQCGSTALYSFCTKTGPDQLFPAGSSFDPLNAVDNRGLWGVTYHVSVQAINRTPVIQPLRLCLTPRGGAYAGAFKWKENLRGIPLLKVNSTAAKESVSILECSLPPGFLGEACSFSLMHAGAVNLPVALWIRSSN